MKFLVPSKEQLKASCQRLAAAGADSELVESQESANELAKAVCAEAAMVPLTIMAFNDPVKAINMAVMHGYCLRDQLPTPQEAAKIVAEAALADNKLLTERKQ